VSEVLDLTTDDTGDSQRMVEIDAVLFVVRGLNGSQLGFNFLQEINMQFNYFATDHSEDGWGFKGPGGDIGKPGAALPGLDKVSAGFVQGWLFGAAADYVVNIFNATAQQVAVLARPHLTTSSGTPATFLAGAEVVFTVTGNIGGDIRPYSFGTTLAVTPTLLRTPAEDGTPRVRLVVEVGRSSGLAAALEVDTSANPLFEKSQVTSEAVINLGQTLILSGISQRESRTGISGVPVLMYIPILKYLFSTRTKVESDSAVIILLTPREPAFADEQNQKAKAQFLEKRRAYLQAKQGTPEDMQRFRERYPDWMQLPPNRFASHFFLMENSELYRAVSGEDLLSDDLDLALLGPKANKKKKDVPRFQPVFQSD
jgi:type II secretory pathway component GspD/PulD (secretin)